MARSRAFPLHHLQPVHSQSPDRRRDRRGAYLPIAIFVAACGGGGGGGANVAPVATEVRLEATAAPLPGDAIELLVSLADELRTSPALLQVAIELPNQLQLPVTDRLTAARPLVTLDGDLVDDQFVVLCGDAENRTASTLAAGPLFRLRLQASQPLLPGTYEVKLRELRAASAAGEVLPSANTAITVPVTLQD